MLAQIEQLEVAGLDGAQRHVAAVDGQVGYSVVTDELGQVFKTKLVDATLSEVYLFFYNHTGA